MLGRSGGKTPTSFGSLEIRGVTETYLHFIKRYRSRDVEETRRIKRIVAGTRGAISANQSFLIVSDPSVAKHILKDISKAYSKGILGEILDFVMGKALIPADGEIWRVRRRAIVLALHQKYVAAMISLFGDATDRLVKKLDAAASDGEDVEMESLFSLLTLDIIGKALFNYDFDSLTNDTGIVEAVYTVLREAEDRSVSPIPVWDIPVWKDLSPRQRKVTSSLKLINDTLNDLIAICKRMVDEEELQFYEESMNEQDPSILHFLLASGDDVSSKQLRDDLMTMLIAGHETSAAVLTWTFYLLSQFLERGVPEMSTIYKNPFEDGYGPMKSIPHTSKISTTIMGALQRPKGRYLEVTQYGPRQYPSIGICAKWVGEGSLFLVFGCNRNLKFEYLLPYHIFHDWRNLVSSISNLETPFIPKPSISFTIVARRKLGARINQSSSSKRHVLFYLFFNFNLNSRFVIGELNSELID
ncbi:hypothetical protein ACHQM5_008855 [Ranunculus cassubicifolius]